MAKILYISYDGITDPLGQSQVIPYLAGLSRQYGYSFTILSCEKKKNFKENKEKIRHLLNTSHIGWEYVFYTKNLPVISTLRDLFFLWRKAWQLHKKEKFSIVHCRSYIPSLIGLEMKKKAGLKFIFDMRGFWADERVEGKLWNLKKPLYKTIYRFFKRKEKDFLSQADYIVSLTEKAKKIIHSLKEIDNQPLPIEVIPCCVDTDHFFKEKTSADRLTELRQQTGIKDTDFVLTYLGSIGTWYMLDEMMHFFSRLWLFYPNAKFLCITHEPEDLIFASAKKFGVPRDRIIVKKALREEVPAYLALSAFSIFFIIPTYSKSASSPTKQAEIMSMGIPVICNAGVGDSDQIVRDCHSGFLIDEMTEEKFDAAIRKISANDYDKNNIRRQAVEHFSVLRGINAYHAIYQRLLN